jgi:thiosulfate/3-mercaptopyruvate sulfurtransferase
MTLSNERPPYLQAFYFAAAMQPLQLAAMSISPLIDARSLAARLDDPTWVVVDCRFNLLDPPAGRAAYLRSHIPGARYADLDRDLARPPGPADGRHPLPDRAELAARLGAWGITNSTTVVAYDEGSGAIAARLWWLLHWLGHGAAAVLDGGFAAWTAAGLPTETDVPAPAPARFVPGAADALAGVVTSAEIPSLQRAGAIVVDARAAPRYRGEQEPIDPVPGHVPGALNRPFSANVGADGRFRPPDELARELEQLLGGRKPEQLVAMCGSGVTACHLLLALAAAGLDGAKLYAGSWSEWIRDPARPIRTGAEP